MKLKFGLFVYDDGRDMNRSYCLMKKQDGELKTVRMRRGMSVDRFYFEVNKIKKAFKAEQIECE